MTIKFALEVGSLVLFAVSAVLWLMSASVNLTEIGPGLDELDRVKALSADLQQMGRWNFWAATSTAGAVVLQIVQRFV